MNKYIDKNLKLTEHFSLSEMCSTSVQTADHNFPSQEVITNLRRLCGWLEELRGRVAAPIYINSGYRSQAVNKAVGGVATSNHLTGCAADIRCTGLEQAIRYAAYLLDISKELPAYLFLHLDCLLQIRHEGRFDDSGFVAYR